MDHKKILSPALAALLFFGASPLVAANAAGFSEEEKYRRDLNRYVMMSNYENAIAIYRGDGSYPLSFSELIPQWWLTKISADPLFRKSEWPEACRKGLTYEAYLREGVAVGYRITACVESQKQKDTLTALGRPTDSMTVSGGDLSPKTVKRTFIDLLDTVETNSKITDASRNRMIREWEDESWLTSDQLVKVNAIAKRIEGMIAKKCWTRSSCRWKFEGALRAEAQKAAYGSERRNLIETVALVVSRKDWFWRTKEAYVPRKKEDRGTRDASSSKPPAASPAPAATGAAYPGCDSPDIALANGQVWAACNVGATKAYAWQAYPSNAEPTAEQKSYLGGYFQWGRNDDVTATAPVDALAAAGTLAGNVGHSSFIASRTYPYDWIATQNGNLWGGASTSLGSGTFADRTASDQALMRWPCAAGYHVPTQLEWATAISAIAWTALNADVTVQAKADLISSTLKLPLAGFRYYRSSAAFNYQGTVGYYWASSTTGANGNFVGLSSTLGVVPAANDFRAGGFSVRCIKDSTQASIK